MRSLLRALTAEIWGILAPLLLSMTPWELTVLSMQRAVLLTWELSMPWSKDCSSTCPMLFLDSCDKETKAERGKLSNQFVFVINAYIISSWTLFYSNQSSVHDNTYLIEIHGKTSRSEVVSQLLTYVITRHAFVKQIVGCRLRS